MDIQNHEINQEYPTFVQDLSVPESGFVPIERQYAPPYPAPSVSQVSYPSPNLQTQVPFLVPRQYPFLMSTQSQDYFREPHPGSVQVFPTRRPRSDKGKWKQGNNFYRRKGTPRCSPCRKDHKKCTFDELSSMCGLCVERGIGHKCGKKYVPEKEKKLAKSSSPSD